jgi:nucleoside 2-deoxyribosyltransferase
MSQPTVYLAGPISGLTFMSADDWRGSVIRMLARHGIKGLSPLRCKEYLDSIGELSGHGREYADRGPLSTPRGVMTRDHFDATRCDVLLVNLWGAKTVSIGTVMEIAWAHQKRTPIVAIVEDQGNVHDHMMVNEALSFRVKSLLEATNLVAAILK